MILSNNPRENLKQFDVLILAAGLGTRLRPLTIETPKPLIRLGKRTLLEYHLERLSKLGVSRVIINLHYLPDKIRQFVGDGSKWKMEVCFSEEPIILDTGGAVKNIEPLLKHGSLLIINADSFFSERLDLAAIVIAHQSSSEERDVTMLLTKSADAKKYGEFGIDSHGKIVMFLGKDYFQDEVQRGLMYVGVQMLNRSVIENFMQRRGTIFSLTKDTLKLLLEQGRVVKSVLYDGYFSDVGTPERLAESEIFVTQSYINS